MVTTAEAVATQLIVTEIEMKIIPMRKNGHKQWHCGYVLQELHPMCQIDSITLVPQQVWRGIVMAATMEMKYWANHLVHCEAFLCIHCAHQHLHFVRRIVEEDIVKIVISRKIIMKR